MLQPLDIGCFRPLAFYYKRELELVTQYNIINIDKIEFLIIVQKAQKLALTTNNIQAAWKTTK